MCSSGTILIEAALIAKNIALVLLNKKFKIFNSKFHNKELWHSLLQIAKEVHKKLLMPIIQGYDADIPTFAVAVDVYGEHVFLQEYHADATIDQKYC